MRKRPREWPVSTTWRRLPAITDILIEAGVRTPPVTLAANNEDLLSPLLDAASERTAAQRVSLPSRDPGLASALVPVFGTLATLHRVPASQVNGLEPIRPLAKTVARLPRIAPGLAKLVRKALESASAALDALPRLQMQWLVHGDFHLGQVLCSSARQRWLIDLEDISLGPREFDVANFAAHLATSPDLWVPSSGHWSPEHLTPVLSACVDSYQQNWPGAPPLCQHTLPVMFASALLRRATKLHVRGDEFADPASIARCAHHYALRID